MKVWVVTMVDTDNLDYAIMGVYSTEEKALGSFADLVKYEHQFEVHELEVDKGNPNVVLFSIEEDV